MPCAARLQTLCPAPPSPTSHQTGCRPLPPHSAPSGPYTARTDQPTGRLGLGAALQGPAGPPSPSQCPGPERGSHPPPAISPQEEGNNSGQWNSCSQSHPIWPGEREAGGGGSLSRACEGLNQNFPHTYSQWDRGTTTPHPPMQVLMPPSAPPHSPSWVQAMGSRGTEPGAALEKGLGVAPGLTAGYVEQAPALGFMASA